MSYCSGTINRFHVEIADFLCDLRFHLPLVVCCFALCARIMAHQLCLIPSWEKCSGIDGYAACPKKNRGMLNPIRSTLAKRAGYIGNSFQKKIPVEPMNPDRMYMWGFPLWINLCPYACFFLISILTSCISLLFAVLLFVPNNGTPAVLPSWEKRADINDAAARKKRWGILNPICGILAGAGAILFWKKAEYTRIWGLEYCLKWRD